MDISILVNNSEGDILPDVKEKVTKKPIRRVSDAKTKTSNLDERPIISLD